MTTATAAQPPVIDEDVLEEALQTLIMDDVGPYTGLTWNLVCVLSDDNAPKLIAAPTFGEAGHETNYRGIVIELSDGSQYALAIRQTRSPHQQG